MGIKKETVKTTVEIDADLLYWTKLKALKEERSLKGIINESLAKYLGGKSISKKRKDIKIGGHKLGGIRGSLRRIDIYEDS